MPSRIATVPPERADAPRLEKVPVAASRCGVSTAQFYRLAKAGHFRIVKVGERASAVDAAEVDAFIRARLAAGAVDTSAQGGANG